jgi:carbon-monoxide dehydrogenase large subunit
VLDERLSAAPERVRYPGEAVAIVVAVSIPAARDAAEAVAVDYRVPAAVTDARGRSVPSRSGCRRPTTWLDQNSAMPRQQAAFAAADLVASRRFAIRELSTARWSRAQASPPTIRTAIPTR